MGQSPLCNGSQQRIEDEEVAEPLVKQQSAFGSRPFYSLVTCGNLCSEPQNDPNNPEHVNVVQECCVQTHRFDAKDLDSLSSDLQVSRRDSSGTTQDHRAQSPSPRSGGSGLGDCFQINTSPTKRTNGSLPHTVRSKLVQPHVRLRFSDFYELGPKIGEGSFGDVFEAVACPLDPATGKPSAPRVQYQQGGRLPTDKPWRRVAVKIFPLGVGTDVQRQDARKHRSFENERTVMAGLEHPNVVKMVECFQEESGLYIVEELCHGGELYARMVASAQEGRSGEDEATAKLLFRQMLLAVSFLRARSITHRDLKTENFLLLGKRGSPEENVLKLCDFGAAVCLQGGQRAMEKVGTLSYTAPEVYLNRGAHLASDAWALGVVLYVVLTGTNPFRLPEHSKEDTVRRIQAGRFDTKRSAWMRTSEEAKHLIRQLLVLDEGSRLTSIEALQHPWVVGTGTRPSVSAGASDLPAQRWPYWRHVSDCLRLHRPRVIKLLRHVQTLDQFQLVALVTTARVACELGLVWLRRSAPWVDLFVELDADKDGALSRTEFVEGCRALLALNEAEAAEAGDMWSTLDLDGSGYVDWAEWLILALLDVEAATEAPEMVNTAFRLLDRPTGDGALTAEDFLVGGMVESKALGVAVAAAPWTARPPQAVDSATLAAVRMEDVRLAIAAASTFA